ncbi:hypothetical protein [Dongshaea marina]|uniref:hypothetical protein n=1 Tax=Dongshaea marina TaxID=2047966 RepID=UPI000D3E917E|nr:hypothetical protein [Dongshaea marina]
MEWKKYIWLPLCLAVPLLAQANPTLEAKIKLLEQQLKALKAEVMKTQAQQKKVVAEVKEAKQQTERVVAQADEASPMDNFNVNGFFSGSVAKASNDVGYAGVKEKVDTEQRSLVGLQMQYNFTDATSITTQIVARAYQNWKPRFEWAFLKHGFDNGLSLRAGKLRMPLYMYSDYLEVGYAQPWARPPGEVYDAVPLSSYTGGDFIYDLDLDWGTLTFQGFAGETRVDEEDSSFGADFTFDNLLGMNVNLNWDEMNFRAVYAQTNVTANNPADGTHNIYAPAYVGYWPSATYGAAKANQIIATMDGSQGWFGGIGFSYDDGEYLVISELVRVQVAGMYPDNDGGYLTLGYRINEFTPYVNAAFMRTNDNGNRASSPVSSAYFDGRRTSYSVGTRWDFMDNLALKADITYSGWFGGTNGQLSGLIASETGATHTMVYSLVLDAAF